VFRPWHRAIGVLAFIVALGAVGATWLRLTNARDDRDRTESLQRRAVGTLATTTARLSRIRADVASTSELIVATRRERDALQALGKGLADELQRTRRSTSDSNIDAFATGSQANVLARCLAGVSRALNQLSVGDGGALVSLQAVAEPCRAVQVG